jgi:hypothetical protein
LTPDAPSLAQGRSVRLCRALLFGLAVSFFAKAALANDHRVEFDIPAQPLDRALDAFGATSGFQIFYETALTAGLRSRPVQGVFNPEEALRLLLQGSDLASRTIAANTITIVQSNDMSPEVLQAKRAAVAYYGVMQAAIMTALCQSTKTRPGTYRAAMQYWVAPSGQVSRVRLIGPSGDRPRDEAIIRAMQTVVLRSFPSNLPQPVTLAIEPSRLGGDTLCAPNRIEPRVR